jgi:hypothetical protein
MKRTSALAVFAFTAWLGAGCAGSGPVPASAEQKQQRYQQALAEAEAAYQKVYAVQYAWRDTEELLSSAKEAAAKGDIDNAIGMATEAKSQSELAYEQYEAGKTAGPRY